MAESAEFKQAAVDVRNLDKTPTNEDYAKMYSLYKQATAGDCNRELPGLTEPMERAKCEAWNSRKGLSRDEAAKQYIQAAAEAKAKYGTK